MEWSPTVPLWARSWGTFTVWFIKLVFSSSRQLFSANKLRLKSEKFENLVLYSFAAFECCSGGSSSSRKIQGAVPLSSWQQGTLERGIFSLPVWCPPASVVILFHAYEHCLSFDVLWRSIWASTDWAAIMSNLAGRTARFLCFTQQVVPSERTQVWVNDKRPSAQVEANIYFRWKQVHLSLPLQKLPIMLWNCLNLFMSLSVLCGSSLLYPLFKVRLWMRDKMFDRDAAVCSLWRCFFHSLSVVPQKWYQLPPRRSYWSHHINHYPHA